MGRKCDVCGVEVERTFASADEKVNRCATCQHTFDCGHRESCRFCHGTGVYDPAGGHEPTACPRHCVSAETVAEYNAATFDDAEDA